MVSQQSINSKEMKYVKLQMTKEDTKGFITNHQELIGSMVLSA